MNNSLKAIAFTSVFLSMCTACAASNVYLQKVEPREKQALCAAISQVLPAKGVEKIVASYMGPEYDEVRRVDSSELIHSKFASAGISKAALGNLAKLPPELLLHAIKFIGTKYIFTKTCSLGESGAIGPQNISLVRCSNDRIAVAYGETLLLVNPTTLLTQTTLTSFDTSQTCAVVALPDNKIACAAGEDGIIRIWDSESGECTQKLIGHEKRIRSLELMSDTILASGSWDRTIKLWNIISGDCVKTLPQPGTITTFAALSKNRLAVRSTGFSIATISIWNTETGTRLHDVQVPIDSAVHELVPLPHARLAVNFGNHRIRILDTESGQWLQDIAAKTNSRIASLAYLPGNKLAIGYFGAGDIDIMSLMTNQLLQTIQSPGGPCVAQLPAYGLISVHWGNKINRHKAIMDCDHRLPPKSKQHCLVQ